MQVYQPQMAPKPKHHSASIWDRIIGGLTQGAVGAIGGGVGGFFDPKTPGAAGAIKGAITGGVSGAAQGAIMAPGHYTQKQGLNAPMGTPDRTPTSQTRAPQQIARRPQEKSVAEILQAQLAEKRLQELYAKAKGMMAGQPRGVA